MSVTEIWKSGVEEVEARLAEAGTHATRLHIVQSFLLAKLARHHRDDRTADQLVRHIHQTQGRLPVAELAVAAGVSRRSLERKLVFTSISSENTPPGLRARVIYRINNEMEFGETFELAMPGKDYRLFLTNYWKRKRFPW